MATLKVRGAAKTCFMNCNEKKNETNDIRGNAVRVVLLRKTHLLCQSVKEKMRCLSVLTWPRDIY
jgi:hypothetical protein